MATNLELLKVGGLITTNSEVDIGNTKKSLDLVTEAIHERIEAGKKIILVPSAHKFANGYGVTDYLEDPINVMNYLRGLAPKQYGQLQIDGPELEQTKDQRITETGELAPRHIGIERYAKLVCDYHIAKAEEFGVMDEAVRAVVEEVGRVIKKRSDYLYKLKSQIDTLPTPDQEVSLVTLVEDKLDSWRGQTGFRDLPDTATIKEMVQGVTRDFPEDLAGIILRKVLEFEYERTKDKIVTLGETLSTILISQYLAKNEISNRRIGSADGLGILTNRNHGGADILVEPTKAILGANLTSLLYASSVVIVPGFCGSTFNHIEKFLGKDGVTVKEGMLEALVEAYKEQKAHGHLSTTQLGRGGSESTAAIIAGCLGIEGSYWVKANVGGVLTAKPDRDISNPLKIVKMDCRTAIETGAIQQRAVEFADQFNLEIRVTSLPDYYRWATKRRAKINGTSIVSDSLITGPQLETGEQTYFIGESEGRYLAVDNVRDRSGELMRILSIPGKYKVNLAETMHHLSNTGFVFDRTLEDLPQAAKDIEEQLGYKTNIHDCVYVRLVSSTISLGQKHRFEKTVDDIVRQNSGGTRKPIYIGAMSSDSNAVTCAVNPNDYKAVKLALYRMFIEHKPTSGE